jgi:hypothetical protein
MVKNYLFSKLVVMKQNKKEWIAVIIVPTLSESPHSFTILRLAGFYINKEGSVVLLSHNASFFLTSVDYLSFHLMDKPASFLSKAKNSSFASQCFPVFEQFL